MAMEQCWLTNQTGAIIRFRPSQLIRLPDHDMELYVKLLDGNVVSGKFHPHPANPYVAGPEVRQWILNRVRTSSREEALIDTTGHCWQLFECEPVKTVAKHHRVSTARAAAGKLTGQDIQRMLDKIDRVEQYKGRRKAYERLLRPPGLRRMVLELMGTSCQAEGCDAANDMNHEWDDTMAGIAILEVHHVEAVARCEDHSPENLCVLCANHHRLIHGFGSWSVSHTDDDVVIAHGTRQLRIVRDLSFLNMA